MTRVVTLARNQVISLAGFSNYVVKLNDSIYKIG